MSLDLILNKWGRLLFNYFGGLNPLILILLICVISILLYKFIFKAKFLNLILFTILVIFASYLIVYLPFKRGERISHVMNSGNTIVNCIEAFKKDMHNYPDSLNEIPAGCLENIERDILKGVSYQKYELDSIRSGVNRSNDVENPAGYFALTIYEEFMGFQYVRYRFKDKKFEFSSD